MYGFVETYPNNVFDSVEIPTRCLFESIKKQKNDPDELIEKKIRILKEIELVDDNMCFLVGNDGILNEEECLNMLQVKIVDTFLFRAPYLNLFINKIYSMPPGELDEFIENEYELLEDEEWDNFSLSNGIFNFIKKVFIKMIIKDIKNRKFT